MDYIQAFISMYIILGSIGNIFLFETLLEGFPKRDKERALKKAYIIAYLIWLPIFFFGLEILDIFGITLDSFRIAGGILLFLISLDILKDTVPKVAKIEHNKEELEKLVVSPIATPLITGPGSITTTMLYTSQGINLNLFLVFSFAYFLSFLTVYNGEKLIEKLGRNILIILNRLMGLILLAISVEFIIFGIKNIL